METIRRSNITVWLILTALTVTLVSIVAAKTMRHRESAPSLVLKAGSKQGSLTVLNESDSSIEVERILAVEAKDGDHWSPITVDFQLVSNCLEANKAARTVKVGSHASLTVVPWTGYSCSSQCATSCRANVAYGPGVYRFIATLAVSHKQVYSDPFNLHNK